jgi:hypothetical protein
VKDISFSETSHKILKGPLYFLGLFMAFCLVFSVQKSAAQRVGFGPKGGANVSLFRGDFPASGMQGPKFGFTAGGYANFRFKQTPQFQLQVEFLYTQRGHTADFVNTITDDSPNPPKEDLKYALSYIEVPILFKYMLNRKGMVRPYFFGGPAYSGILSATLTNKKSESDVKESIKRDDLGLMLGWGISTFIIDRWYHLDIRYYHGLLNSSENLTNDLKPFNEKFKGQIISEYRLSTLSITLGVGIERREAFFLK